MSAVARQRLLDLALAVCAVAMVLAFMGPTAMRCVPDAAGHRTCTSIVDQAGSTDDWRYFAGVWEASRVALHDFHQLPSWNPYHCGGVVLFADPQAPFPGPIFLLTYAWLGTAVAMKLWVTLHLLAGAFGAMALTRLGGANRPEQLLAATLVSTCGFVGLHFGGGHLSFTPFLLFPWVLYGARRALEDPRWSVLTASLLALTVYEGGTYPLPLMLVGLATDTLARLADARDRRALLRSLPVLGVLFPLLAGWRLVPVLRYLGEHPRLVPLDDMMALHEVIQTWTARTHERAFPGHVFVWPEYGDYIGAVPVILMAFGAACALLRHDGDTRARRIDLAVLAIALWMALGNIPGLSLFGLLHELPVYKSLRVPSRFLYPATVALALVATGGLTSARAWLNDTHARRWMLWAFVALECALTAAVAVDIHTANSIHIQSGGDAPIAHTRASSAFQQTPGADYGAWPTYPVRGVGTTACYVPLEWGPAPGLWHGAGPQFRVEPPDSGVVRQTRWSPNAVDFDVNLTRPARLVINQNHESSWRTSHGEIDRTQPILTVALRPGRASMRVSHRAWGMRLGAAMTLLGWVLAALVVWLNAARREALDAWVLRMWRRAEG